MNHPSVWYLAHPVGPACACGTGLMPSSHEAAAEMVACNVARAKRWLRWCWEVAPDVAIIAPWMAHVELLDDANPTHRERGLRDNCAAAALCDGIIGSGGRWSPEMTRERNALVWAPEMQNADCVLDLTPLGPEPPTRIPAMPLGVSATIALIDRLRALR